MSHIFTLGMHKTQNVTYFHFGNVQDTKCYIFLLWERTKLFETKLRVGRRRPSHGPCSFMPPLAKTKAPNDLCSKRSMRTLLWFRKALRLHDNRLCPPHALSHFSRAFFPR
jgi:hypothetical protein